MMENEIDEATYKALIDPEIHLMDADKIEHDSTWSTYKDRKSRLGKQQGKD